MEMGVYWVKLEEGMIGCERVLEMMNEDGGFVLCVGMRYGVRMWWMREWEKKRG